MAEAIIERLDEPFVATDGQSARISASVGLALAPRDGTDIDMLLAAADRALYAAKRRGKGSAYLFEPELDQAARDRQSLEQDLRQALERGKFELAFQPILDLGTQRFCGFEALLRWQHRVAGTIAPGVFIPLLEETRLINRLGSWIFQAGVEQCRQMSLQYGSDLVISLNVSPVQFGMPQLVDDLRRVLEEHQLNPRQLEVEVTESALMQDLETSQEQLRQLRKLGVKIAIDDFGTGYSSLAYLRHFELDTLKIDRLFISNMLDSPRDAAVVSTIIDLGRNLGLEVIAEGVETMAQRDWLAAHNCAIMQGFLVAPGLNAEQIKTFPAQLDWHNLPLRNEKPAG